MKLNRFLIKLSISVFWLIFTLTPLAIARDNSQSNDSNEKKSSITHTKKRLLILPSKQLDNPKSIDNRITAIVAKAASDLKRFQIIDRNHLKTILKEIQVQMKDMVDENDVVELGKIAAAKEGIIVQVVNFGQKGVPPEGEEDQGLFEKVVVALITKRGEEKYPNNIHTTLRAIVKMVSVETGQTLKSFNLNAEYTGGVKSHSLNQVLSRIESQASRQLRKMYLINSEVLENRDGEITLLLGEDMGLTPGIWFNIYTPSKKRKIAGREFVIFGKRIGLMEISAVNADSSQGKLVRCWDQVLPGHKLVENASGANGAITFAGIYNHDSRFSNFNFQLEAYPLNRISGFFDLGLGFLKDSRDEIDFNFSLGLGVIGRIIKTNTFALGGIFRAPLVFPFRADDNDNMVSKLIFSPRVGAISEFMVDDNLDLVLAAEYLLISAGTSWRFSKGDDDDSSEMPGKWTSPNSRPEIIQQGFYFSLGIRYLFF